jgi:imidazole glycerol phosphate synthase subunit HisF
MSRFVPHLLLFNEAGTSYVATLLRTAGYLVTSVGHACEDELFGDADGVVVELPALATIATVRKIALRFGRDLVVLVITPAVDAMRRVLPSARVVRSSDVDDDLISTIDLALAAQHMQQTG